MLHNDPINEPISLKALYELHELRAELRKSNPNGEKIFELLCGTKYNESMS